MKHFSVFAFVLASAWMLPEAKAGQIALSFTGGSPLNDAPTVGWRFTIAAPIEITGLGFFDVGGDGLIDSHQVAIWTNAGVLQGSATVPSGTVGTLDNGFRFTTASFVLAAGDYVIGGDKPTGADNHISNVLLANTTLAAGITYVENRYIFDGGAFSLPNLTFGPQERGYFGANFQFTDVPEPATWGLVSIAWVVLVMLRRKAASATLRG